MIKNLILLVVFMLSALSQAHEVRFGDYGLALRGNGELQAAHWGAMARVIEDHGVPNSQAGGSSASITMFYLDSMLDNQQALEGFNNRDTAERISFMFKSLEGFTWGLSETEQAKSLQRYYELLSRDWPKIQEQLSKVNQAETTEAYLEDARVVVQTLSELGLFPKSSYQKIAFAIQSTSAGSVAAAKFEASELINSIKVFGKFNAKEDHNLFFRPGIVDFGILAKQFSKVAMFYAQYKSQSAHAFASWMDLCAKNSKGKSWKQITQNHPGCQTALQRLMESYFIHLQDSDVEEFLSRNVGMNIDTLVTTAVITGKSVEQVTRLFSEYDFAKSESFGKDFKLSRSEDLKFGYWGRISSLNRIERRLDRQFDRHNDLDEKESRFLSLGEASWGQVLSISPAEPGLSSLKLFSGPRGEKLYSAGGWSDLHPTQVLKGLGARDVIYVTREGGESIFAQGIAKRLLGLNKAWSSLMADANGKAPQSSFFDVHDQRTLWSQLFNLGNLNSAYSRAVSGSSLVYLTKWNDFNIKQGISPMIDQSYNSYYLSHSAVSKPVRVADASLACFQLLRK